MYRLTQRIPVGRRGLVSQSIPTGYMAPGQPPGNFFERANPGHPGNLFV